MDNFIDPYIHLDIPDTDLTVQVKLEGEGVCIDVFKGEGFNNSIASTWKLYDEMNSSEEEESDE